MKTTALWLGEAAALWGAYAAAIHACRDRDEEGRQRSNSRSQRDGPKPEHRLPSLAPFLPSPRIDSGELSGGSAEIHTKTPHAGRKASM